MHRKALFKRLFATALVLLQMVQGVTFAAVPQFETAPVSDEYAEYLENPQDYGGYIPSPLRIARSNQAKSGLLFSGMPLPSKYDPVYQSPAKNQFVDGPCWAFAALSSVESLLIKNGQQVYDFSERNLMNNHGFDVTYDEGGNREFAVAYLARWAGPVFETDDYAYRPFAYNLTMGYMPDKVRKHIQDIVYLTEDIVDVERIKRAVMEYGSVSAAMLYDSLSYSMANNAHYYNGPSSIINHGITIVGWDNSFSKTNFLTQPPANGAFICKNSWGDGYGDNGYFYVSYYDKLIGQYSYAIASAEDKDNYDNIYQYDPLGATSSMGVGDETLAGLNVFTASSSQFEKLSAVSFYALAENTSYKIYTMPGYDGGDIDSDAFTFQQSGTITYPGYYTIRLDTPASLAAGEKFIVAVELTTPGFNYPVAIESPDAKDASGKIISSKASANPYESFVGYSVDDNMWWALSDLPVFAESNFCIKAFTDITPVSIGVQQASYTVSEDAGNAVVTVVRSQNTQEPVTVNYATASGTASAGLDYTAVSSTLSFAENETVKTISIPIIDDRIKEGDETFSLVLSSPSDGALMTDHTSIITITDNDQAFSDVTQEGVTLMLGSKNISTPTAFAALSGAQSGLLSLSAMVENHTISPLDVTVALALYKTVGGKDVLKGIAVSAQDTSTLRLASGQSKPYTAAFYMNADDISQYKIKILFINSLSGLSPHTGALIYD